MSIAAPDPDDSLKAHQIRHRQVNTTQMRNAYEDWKASKTNDKRVPLLVDTIESVDSTDKLIKARNPHRS